MSSELVECCFLIPMSKDLTYVDLTGHVISLVHLDAEERKVVMALQREAARHPDWDTFDNYWPRAVLSFYDARGMPRTTQTQTVLFQIAMDLSSRLGIASGQVASDDYLGDLMNIIWERFGKTKRAFCNATGISETMLSHVLAGRKGFSVDSFARALDKIGFTLRILPKLTTTLPAAVKTVAKTKGKLEAVKKPKRKVG